MTSQPTVGDIYAPLADLLANLMAKYADVLELDDNRKESVPDAKHGKPRPSESMKGSLAQASPLFLLHILNRYDILYAEILSKPFCILEDKPYGEGTLNSFRKTRNQGVYIYPGFNCHADRRLFSGCSTVQTESL